MYTFIISILAFLLISGLIYGKNINRYKAGVFFIILLGTAITVSMANLALGKNFPYKQVEVKEFILDNNGSFNIEGNEEAQDLDLGFSLDINEDKTKMNLDLYNIFKSYESIDINSDRFVFKLANKKDTVSYYKMYKCKRHTDNKWTINFGYPIINKKYIIYLKNDSSHRVIYNYIQKYKNNGKNNITESTYPKRESILAEN